MNPPSALEAVRRRWWLVVLFAVAGAAFGALPETEQVESQVTRTFSATR